MKNNKINSSCPVCGGKILSTIHTLYDDRYGYPGTFPLRKCHHCRHIFLQGTFSPELLRKLYSDFYPRSQYSEESHHPYLEISEFRAWFEGAKSATFRWIPKNVSILDIGCGFGESLGYHKGRGCEVIGVEADNNICRIADKYGYKVHVGLFNPDEFKENYFDYVTMSQVIEHVSNPIQTLQGIGQILKPGGLAILSTPNANGWGSRFFGKRWINWHAPYHLHFFSKSSIEIAAVEAGLSLERTCIITPSNWLHYQWIHLATYPPEGVPSAFWGTDGGKTLVQKITLAVLALLHYCKLNHLVTRFFDFFGVGDSQVYFFRKPTKV